MSNVCLYCPPIAAQKLSPGALEHFAAWHEAGHPKLDIKNYEDGNL